MHEFSGLAQYAVPAASAGGLAAIAGVARARLARRPSRAISREAIETDRVERELDGGENLEAISFEIATRPKSSRVLRIWRKGLISRE